MNFGAGPYSWATIGGFLVNGSWIRIGQTVQRYNARLGYCQEARIESVVTNGHATWVSFSRATYRGFEVDYSTEYFYA